MIGAMLLSREVIAGVRRTLSPSDFYTPNHALAFTAICALYEQATTADPVTVAAELKALKGAPTAVELHSLTINVPALSSASRYAQIVRRAAAGRHGLGFASEYTEAIYGGADPYAATDELAAKLDEIDRAGALPHGFSTYAEFMDGPEADSPVLIPGRFPDSAAFMYEDTRLVVTSTEGGGKSTWLRVLAWSKAMGVHPWWPGLKIEPANVVILDLENPRRELRTTGHLLRHRLRSLSADYDESRVLLWRRPQGANIRDRVVRSQLERILAETRPKLVVGGPVYKMARKTHGEGWDEAADATHEILDDLRIRYGFGLVLEAHATLGKDAKGKRDLRIFGGERWLAWPDVCRGLRPDNGRLVPEFAGRGDRGTYEWPSYFRRGTRPGSLPWEAVYEKPKVEAMPFPDEPSEDDGYEPEEPF